MLGGEDDDDFLPASNSKLASLFSSKSIGEGNTSLTYTAPKQPKKRGDSSKSESRTSTTGSSPRPNTVPAQTSTSNKLGIIIVKAVNTYKLEDGNYNLEGKLGAAVLGNAAVCVYQLLLYKGKQHHITSTKITPNFQFTVQANNYGTFYDDQKQNWSIHFDQDEDAEEFAKEIGLARGNSQGGNGGIQNLLTQDLSTGEGPTANVGDSMEIFYSVRLFMDNKLGQLVESNLQADKPQRVKIRRNVWEEGLIGANKGSKRIILLPPSLVGPWKQEAPPNTSLVVEVEVSRLKQAKGSHEETPSNLTSVADSSESAVDSSTDETSIKARGASISEALTASPKTHKANIISRMARMGQATLPLKGAVACNPTDSEDSEDEHNNPPAAKPPIIFKPSLKIRSPKIKPIAPQPPSSPENHPTGTSNVNKGLPPQQMAVYQPLTGWQQQQQTYTVGQYGIGQLDGQLYPLVPNQTISSHQLIPSAPSTAVGTPPGIPSTDGHLSVFLSETRTHNTEVRIGVAKVADKVDQVLAKLDSVHSLRPAMSSALLDPTSLLASIQKLVSENEQLKAELIEKGNKVEVQNDRIYQLLNTNHKYLEQSNTSSNDQRNQEALVSGLQREKTHMLEELNDSKGKVQALLAQVESYRKENSELSSMMAKQQEELTQSKSVVIEQDTNLHRLNNKLKQTLEDHVSREKTITTLNETIMEMQGGKEELEASLSKMTQQLKLQKCEADEHYKKLHAKYSSKIVDLEMKGANSISDGEVEKKSSEPVNNKLVIDKVKKVMNVVYNSLHREFNNGKMYLGEHVKETLATTIRDTTCQLFEEETARSSISQGSACLGQQEKRISVKGIGEMSKEKLVAVSELHSDPGDSSNYPVNDSKGTCESSSMGCSEMPKESDVQSELLLKPVDDLPSVHDVQQTDTSSSTDSMSQMLGELPVVSTDTHFHNVENLNPTADGPKDVNDTLSDMMTSYVGGNAGDIPTVPLAKLPGETDLSVKLVSTDSETVTGSINHLRVTSDSCVLGTAPKVRDDSTRESVSADSQCPVTRPVTVPTTTGALRVDVQPSSTNERKKEIVQGNPRESSLERTPWRSEPPPLFDDEEDEDDWLR